MRRLFIGLFHKQIRQNLDTLISFYPSSAAKEWKLVPNSIHHERIYIINLMILLYFPTKHY